MHILKICVYQQKAMAMVRSCGPVNTVITTSPAVNFVPVAIGENNSGVHRPTGRYFGFLG